MATVVMSMTYRLVTGDGTPVIIELNGWLFDADEHGSCQPAECIRASCFIEPEPSEPTRRAGARK